MKDLVRPPSAKDYTEALEGLFGKESARRDELLKKQKEVFGARASMQEKIARNEPVNSESLGVAEDEYWKLEGKIREINQFTDDLLELLGQLEDGRFKEVESRLRQIFPELQPPQKQLSKRKKAILAANDGIMPNWIDHMLEATIAGPAETRRVTTGRRATKVKGVMDPFYAEQVFHTATADTHGGKVRGGSKFGKGRFFVDAKGRRKNKR